MGSTPECVMRGFCKNKKPSADRRPDLAAVAGGSVLNASNRALGAERLSGEDLRNRVVNVTASILALAALVSMILLAGCTHVNIFLPPANP